MQLRALALGLILVLPAAADTTSHIADDEVEARVITIAQTLNSPLVDGHTLANSGTTFAATAIELIEEQVRAGQSDDEIRTYFRQRYGSAMVTPATTHEADH